MIKAYKDAFHRADSPYLHFNNAGVAPWPKSTEAAVREWSTIIAAQGTHLDRNQFEKSDETRGLLAKFLGANADQIAFFQTCATAISQVALGLSLDKGAEIITWDQEYPSNFYPWKLAADRAEGKLVIAKSEASLATPFETIEKLVTPKTRVIAVSWVQYRNGAITDLARLSHFARSRGIITCIDIIQGAGVLPFNFNELGLDFACGGAHKWMTSPLSFGFLMMRPEHVNRLTPLSVGAVSFGGYDKLADVNTKMVDGVARYEPGGRCLLETIGLGETLKLMSSVGIDAIASEANAMATRLIKGLEEKGYAINSPHGESFRGAIVNFSPTSNSPARTVEDAQARLTKARVSFATRPPGIRLSPHAFTPTDHIDRLIEALS